MILAGFNIIPHLSFAVRSAINMSGWTDCAAVVAEASTCFVHAGPGSGIDAVLANRVAKHSLRDVGLEGATGIPTHVFVATVFLLTEYEQIACMRKIGLNFRDAEPEAP